MSQIQPVDQASSSRKYAFLCAIIVATGGFLFGFDSAVISAAEQLLKDTFQPAKGLTENAKNFWHGFLVASALIGTIIGSILVSKPSDRFGRRMVMFQIALLFIISAVGSSLASDWYSFVAFRFIGGLALGGSSVVSPMYIAEISPANLRGRLVSIAQICVVIGILLGHLSNYSISSMEFGAAQWRWMFGIEAVPAIAYFLLLFLTPRSPRWLLAKGNESEARTVLQRLGTDPGESIDVEILEIKKTLDTERQNHREPLFQRKYSKPIMLAMMIAAFNQLSGINVILYYSKRIFESAGFGESASLINSAGIGLVNLVFTIIAVTIIDSFGRKKLIFVGSIGYILSLGATAAAFYTQSSLVLDEETGKMVREISETGGWIVFVSLLCFMASHAFGQGAIIWVFISEIFPNRVRARGQALGSFTHWIFCAAISLSFPLFAEAAGGHIFAFYCICMVAQLIWVITCMPETKGIPLEEIQKKLGIE